MPEKRVEVWFGEMEFGTFSVGSNPHIHVNQIALVHNIAEKRYMDPDKVEEAAEGCDWLVPSEFEGDIVFSKTFLKGLINF